MDIRCYILREGVIREDIELLFEGDPVVELDESRPIPGSLRGRFQPLPQVDLLTDHIVCLLDGEPCGDFVVRGCQTLYDGDCALWELDAGDQCLLAARHRQESRRWAQAGESYLELIRSLLRDCGIERILMDDCAATLPTERQWELGTCTLTIINQLLEELGFCPLHFDREGYARLKAYRPPLEQSIRHVYGEGGGLLELSCRSSMDIFDAKNIFVVVADSPERRESLVATARNDDPNSPISTVNLGPIMAEPVVLEQVADEAALQTLAERLRDQSLLSAEEVRFSTEPALHDWGETLALEHPQLGGIYREKSWRLHLGEGIMEHICQRYVAFAQPV